MSDKHPGEILKREILLRKVTNADAAREMGISPAALSRLINQKQALTAELAIKVGVFCRLEPLWLLGQQNAYDLNEVMRKRENERREQAGGTEEGEC